MTHEASSSSISRSVRPNSVFLVTLDSETETRTDVLEQIFASDHETKHSELMVRGGHSKLIVRGGYPKLIVRDRHHFCLKKIEVCNFLFCFCVVFVQF